MVRNISVTTMRLDSEKKNILISERSTLACLGHIASRKRGTHRGNHCATTVTKKGNKLLSTQGIHLLHKEGLLPNFYTQTKNNMAARLAKGIMFQTLAIVMALIQQKETMYDGWHFVFPSNAIIAELLTHDRVMGKPQISPEKCVLPSPCALSPLLVRE